MTFPTEPTEIKLSDGLVRHLRYPLSELRAIKKQWGAEFSEILKHPADELLPDVLWRGLVEKDGLTPESMDALITGEATDYLTLCFVQAFFGQRARKNAEALLEQQLPILAALERLKTAAQQMNGLTPGVSAPPSEGSGSPPNSSGA